MSLTCPKCKGQLGPADFECPNCGIVLAKFRDTSTLPLNMWLVVVNDKECRATYEHLKVLAAEDRVKLTDRVKKPGAPWKTVGDYPELLITITTGDIHTPYEPIDAIFAFDSHSSGSVVFGGGTGDPNRAFDGVKRQLRLICRAVGGHAVINCEFEYRVASGAALLGINQVIEIFAYGTAVRFRLAPEETTSA